MTYVEESYLQTLMVENVACLLVVASVVIYVLLNVFVMTVLINKRRKQMNIVACNYNSIIHDLILPLMFHPFFQIFHTTSSLDFA